MKYLKIYEEYKYSDIKIGNYVVLNIKKMIFGTEALMLKKIK